MGVSTMGSLIRAATGDFDSNAGSNSLSFMVWAKDAFILWLLAAHKPGLPPKAGQ